MDRPRKKNATDDGRSERDAERRRVERSLDIGLEETFPASDPVALTEPRRPDRRHG